MSVPVSNEQEAGRTEARPARSAGQSLALTRVIWRWHFWAGLLVAPVLFIASLTGGIYIFKDEVEPLLYPEVLTPTGSGSRASLQSQIDAAQDYLGEGWSPSGLSLNNVRGTSTNVSFVDEDHHRRSVYVDPYSAVAMGELPEVRFFPIVRTLHRRLYAGTFGRVLVELTTCWTVMLSLSGLYLWWPRNWRRLAGVLKPRLLGNRYVALRDLHAIPGAFAAPIVIVIALTGLLYSVLWGTAFLAIGFSSGAFDIAVNPPKSVVPVENAQKETVRVDEVFSLMRKYQMPEDRISLVIPHEPEESYAIKSGTAWGPSVSALLFVDQYSGKVIQHSGLTQLPWMAQWTQWNYPLHIGSVMGLTTKIVWLLISIFLCAAPVTGIWMWQLRRKPGTMGFPKHYQADLPRWLKVTMAMFGVCLPMAGLSMLAVAGFEWISSRRAATRNSSQSSRRTRKD